jgi:hypothetical protein
MSLQTADISVRIPFRNLKEEPECLLTKQILTKAVVMHFLMI